MWKLFHMMSTGREGLVASVSGVHTMKLMITVHEKPERFCRHENLLRSTEASSTANTTICGRVRTAPESASQAHDGSRFSTRRIAARMKKMLMTWFWPQTDMLNHTAGLNRNRPPAVACQRRLAPIAPMIQ